MRSNSGLYSNCTVEPTQSATFCFFVILLFTTLMWFIDRHVMPYSILLIRKELLIVQIRMGATEHKMLVFGDL